MYWAEKARSVVAVERDETWFKKLQPMMPRNVELIHCRSERGYPNVVKSFANSFDIIIIDGAVRFPSLTVAEKKLSDSGFIIFDNTEWYPNSAKYLRDMDYIQIDFCGFPPINAFTSCTSIFFKNPELLRNKRAVDCWRPIGSRYLVPCDDVPIDQIYNLKE